MTKAYFSFTDVLKLEILHPFIEDQNCAAAGVWPAGDVLPVGNQQFFISSSTAAVGTSAAKSSLPSSSY